MSAPYEIRNNDTGRSKKQSMAELKLRRLNELNQRLQEDLRHPWSESARLSHRVYTSTDIKSQPYCFHRQGAQGLHGSQPLGHREYTQINVNVLLFLTHF